MKLSDALRERCPTCGEKLEWEANCHYPPDWSAWCCDHEFYISVVEVSFERISNDPPPVTEN